MIKLARKIISPVIYIAMLYHEDVLGLSLRCDDILNMIAREQVLDVILPDVFILVI
jgi:hypothetical protein